MLRLGKNKGNSLLEIVICVALIGILLQYIITYSVFINRIKLQNTIKAKGIELVEYTKDYIKCNIPYKDLNKYIDKEVYLQLNIKEFKNEYTVLSVAPKNEMYIKMLVTEESDYNVLKIDLRAIQNNIETMGSVYKGKY